VIQFKLRMFIEQRMSHVYEGLEWQWR